MRLEYSCNPQPVVVRVVGVGVVALHQLLLVVVGFLIDLDDTFHTGLFDCRDCLDHVCCRRCRLSWGLLVLQHLDFWVFFFFSRWF